MLVRTFCNSSKDNDVKQKQVHVSLSTSNIIVLGDFNCPNIYGKCGILKGQKHQVRLDLWISSNICTSTSKHECLYKIRRRLQAQQDDLVCVNDGSTADKLIYFNTLNKSDHKVMTWRHHMALTPTPQQVNQNYQQDAYWGVKRASERASLARAELHGGVSN